MATTESSTGMTVNKATVLPADEYLGADAFTVYDSNYSNGKGARCTIPDGVIFESSYFPCDTFTGTHQFTLIYSSDDTTTEGLYLEVWKRTPGMDDASHDSSTDQYFATNGTAGVLMADKIGWFDPLYEYKFILKTSPDFNGSYMDVDLFQMLRINRNQFIGFWEDYEGNVGVQNFIQKGQVTVSNDGSDSYSTTDVIYDIPFYSEPVVVFTPVEQNIPTFVVNIWASSASGFTLLAQSSNAVNWTGNLPVNWIAVGSLMPTSF
jgi:hypothetical protein